MWLYLENHQVLHCRASFRIGSRGLLVNHRLFGSGEYRPTELLFGKNPNVCCWLICIHLYLIVVWEHLHITILSLTYVKQIIIKIIIEIIADPPHLLPWFLSVEAIP